MPKVLVFFRKALINAATVPPLLRIKPVNSSRCVRIMILTQRDEFTGLIRNNGGTVAALISALRKKTKTLGIRGK